MRAAIAAVAEAQDQVEAARDGAVVSTQLRVLADAMTSPATVGGGDSDGASDSIGIVGDYLDELAAAYPEVRSLAGVRSGDGGRDRARGRADDRRGARPRRRARRARRALRRPARRDALPGEPGRDCGGQGGAPRDREDVRGAAGEPRRAGGDPRRAPRRRVHPHRPRRRRGRAARRRGRGVRLRGPHRDAVLREHDRRPVLPGGLRDRRARPGDPRRRGCVRRGRRVGLPRRDHGPVRRCPGGPRGRLHEGRGHHDPRDPPRPHAAPAGGRRPAVPRRHRPPVVRDRARPLVVVLRVGPRPAGRELLPADPRLRPPRRDRL